MSETEEGTGERFRRLREAAKISQGELGKRVGHNQRWVSYRETGVSKISIEDAILIAGGLGKTAALVICEQEVDAFMKAVNDAPPEHIEMARLLLKALPHMQEETRAMLKAMFALALERAGVEGEGRAAG